MAIRLWAGRQCITLGNTGGANQVAIEGTSTLTLGSDILIHGENGTIGQAVFVGGSTTIVNNGRISADVATGLIALAANQTNNAGTLEALNGGTLRLDGQVTNTGSGHIDAGAGSTVIQNGVTITGGALNSTGSGTFVATNSYGNFLSGVTLNGTLDLASNVGIERVVNGLTLNNGKIDVNSGSWLTFSGDQTLGGTGAIVLGNTGGNYVGIEGTSTLTVGSDILIHGENGTIGQAVIVGGSTTIVNNGRISADVATGLIDLAANQTNNAGTLEALNGGTLRLDGQVTNTGSGHIDAGEGSSVIQNNVTITGGTLNSTGSGKFVANSNFGNYLSGVTLNGTLDLATNTGIERVVNGLTLNNGKIDVNNGSYLTFSGDQTLGGTGAIILGNTGGNYVGIEGSSTLTLDSNVAIRGENGIVGTAIFVGGSTALVNNGLISADVNGGTIFVQANSTTNNGTLEAKNGGTLQLSNTVTNNNLVQALANPAVTYDGGATTTNNVAGTLTGGLWIANAVGGSSATITLRGSDITTNNADVYLQGMGSVIQVGATSIDTTLETNNGSLRIQDGRVFNATANSGDFTNNGILEDFRGSTFQSNTLNSNGTVASFGNNAVDHQ